MLKIETLPNMLLHLKHMSENFSSLRKESLNAVYIGQHCWVQQNTWGFPKSQKWSFVETYQLIPSNQKHFNIT